MMRYFDLFDDMSTSNRWHIGEVAFDDGTEARLRFGIKLDRKEVLNARVTHAGPPLDFCLTSFGVPIAAPKIALLIAEIAGDDVQCLELRIKGHPDRVALNATRLVRCLDERHTVFSKWIEKDRRPDLVGHYRNVRNLTVDPGRIPDDAHFFRIAGYLGPLIVSEAVKDAMERAGCTGADFRDVNPPAGK